MEHAISSLGSKVALVGSLNDSDLRKDMVVGKLPQIVVSWWLLWWFTMVESKKKLKQRKIKWSLLKCWVSHNILTQMVVNWNLDCQNLAVFQVLYMNKYVNLTVYFGLCIKAWNTLLFLACIRTRLKNSKPIIWIYIRDFLTAQYASGKRRWNHDGATWWWIPW